VIKALSLIFKPMETWDGILLARRSTLYLLVRYLLPMMVLAAVAEAFGLVEWGRHQTGLHRIRKFTVDETVVYGVLRSLLLLLAIVI
jgi:hypothetical protein